MLERIQVLLSRVSCNLMDKTFDIIISEDLKFPNTRVFIQLKYNATCTKEQHQEVIWKGRKFYLSEYMTDDEIIKTIYVAFEMAVKHEIMEGFKVDGIVLFNPHVNFEELLKISHKEIIRKN